MFALEYKLFETSGSQWRVNTFLSIKLNQNFKTKLVFEISSSTKSRQLGERLEKNLAKKEEVSIENVGSTTWRSISSPYVWSVLKWILGQSQTTYQAWKDGNINGWVCVVWHSDNLGGLIGVCVHSAPQRMNDRRAREVGSSNLIESAIGCRLWCNLWVWINSKGLTACREWLGDSLDVEAYEQQGWSKGI